jgi:hypothetical protein
MTIQTTFKPEYAAQAHKLASLGATDREMAEFFDVSVRTFHRWKHTHEGFADELRLGKEAADARVEQSLYHRAVGYSYDAVKIFQHNGSPVIAEYVEHCPPDTTAAIFWLKNRRPEDWREKSSVEMSGAEDLAESIKRARLRAIEGSDAK